MKSTLLRNCQIVNRGTTTSGDILIQNGRITQIGAVSMPSGGVMEYDAGGRVAIPGLIDDQVHFREPGLTHKGTIATESRAALAGGITSYLEMPNTNPQTTTMEAWQAKMDVAARDSWANYGFMFGGTNDNLETIKALDTTQIPALKLFLGSSTGNMLVDDELVLRSIFSTTPLRIAAHCEDEATIKANLQRAIAQYGDDIPIGQHPIIRSHEACYISSSRAIRLARETGARLHVFHLSTGKETELLDKGGDLRTKQITSEVCVHHLWFQQEDYELKGTHIKWNPAVKMASDRDQLWKALLDDRIDVLATDHAPHTLDEKKNPYTSAPSGGPLVQHALIALLEKVADGTISLERLVEKACHNPAILFDMKDRGYLEEGMHADIVLIDQNKPWTVAPDNIEYKCGWSPFEGTQFNNQVHRTYVNGQLAYDQGTFLEKPSAQAITYDR